MTKRTAMGFAVLAASAWLGSAAACGKVIAQDFADVAKQAAVVMIGQVERVRAVQGVSVADVRRAVVLKGTCGEMVPVMADGTWMCDISTAVEGEWALFALEPVPAENEMGIEASKRVRGFLEWARGQRGDARPMMIGFWGRGRLPIRVVGGVDCVMPESPDLMFPEAVRRATIADEGRDGVVLDDAVALVAGAGGGTRWDDAPWRRVGATRRWSAWRLGVWGAIVLAGGWMIRWFARRRRVKVR